MEDSLSKHTCIGPCDGPAMCGATVRSAAEEALEARAADPDLHRGALRWLDDVLPGMGRFQSELEWIRFYSFLGNSFYANS